MCLSPFRDPKRIFQIAAGRVVQRMTLGVLFAGWALASMSLAEQIDSTQDSFRFDAGPVGSSVEDGALELSLESAYSPDVGFGWTLGPREDFIRQQLSRSRSSMTIDGVSGQRLEFRADVASGTWFVTLWAEAGREDATSLQLLMQSRRQSLGWQAFRSPGEPRRSIQKTYRVFQGTAEVGSEGLSIKLIGRHGQVRLLGIALIRQVHPSTMEHQQLMELLTSAGQYNSRSSLNDLVRQVQDSLQQDHWDPFYALWLERLELLVLAERYFSMRGWEWAKEETGLGMFDRLRQAVMLLDGLLSTDTEQADPLTERALYLRGRILYWLGKQVQETKEDAAGQRDLKRLFASYPDDQLLAMYTGERIDLPDECDCVEATAEAPTWSLAQREALCRLRQIAHWWVREQQAANGEFGGKLGDDVELLRWWAPLVLSGDKTAQQGWIRLANGVWESKHVHEGYARKLDDVEHASEYVADTMCLMTIFRHDPGDLDRLVPSAKLFENLWTGKTTKGNRFFRSTWFSSTAVDTEEPKGRDVEYNSRIIMQKARRHTFPKA